MAYFSPNTPIGPLLDFPPLAVVRPPRSSSATFPSSETRLFLISETIDRLTANVASGMTLFAKWSGLLTPCLTALRSKSPDCWMFSLAHAVHVLPSPASDDPGWAQLWQGPSIERGRVFPVTETPWICQATVRASLDFGWPFPISKEGRDPPIEQAARVLSLCLASVRMGDGDGVENEMLSPQDIPRVRSWLLDSLEESDHPIFENLTPQKHAVVINHREILSAYLSGYHSGGTPVEYNLPRRALEIALDNATAVQLKQSHFMGIKSITSLADFQSRLGFWSSGPGAMMRTRDRVTFWQGQRSQNTNFASIENFDDLLAQLASPEVWVDMVRQKTGLPLSSLASWLSKTSPPLARHVFPDGVVRPSAAVIPGDIRRLLCACSAKVLKDMIIHVLPLFFPDGLIPGCDGQTVAHEVMWRYPRPTAMKCLVGKFGSACLLAKNSGGQTPMDVAGIALRASKDAPTAPAKIALLEQFLLQASPSPAEKHSPPTAERARRL